MKTIAASFPQEEVSLYHCASDPQSLDAVVLEERGIYLADATAPHEQSVTLPYVTGETIDLARLLDGEPLQAHRAEIAAVHHANQTAHARAKNGMAGIAAMQDSVCAIGAEALLREKLLSYAKRLVKRILPASKSEFGKGTVVNRQCAALTPQGWQTLLPDGFDVITLEDSYGCAASLLLEAVTQLAVEAGWRCEVTRSLFQTHRPMLHLMLPEAHLLLLTVSPFAPCEVIPAMQLRMQRFYDVSKLRSQRTLARFCVKTAQSMMEQSTALLQEALRLHDDLEHYYIASQNREALSTQAQQLIAAIRARTE